jgi:hypothetical protein
MTVKKNKPELKVTKGSKKPKGKSVKVVTIKEKEAFVITISKIEEEGIKGYEVKVTGEEFLDLPEAIGMIELVKAKMIAEGSTSIVD